MGSVMTDEHQRDYLELHHGGIISSLFPLVVHPALDLILMFHV
jgi:hypothetical protein